MEILTFYEKKSCISCQKAKQFLNSLFVEYDLIDIEKNPPSRQLLEQLVDENNIQASLNTRSTIYREKNLGKVAISKSEVIDLMLEDPNLIKRPLIEKESGALIQGYDEARLAAFLR